MFWNENKPEIKFHTSKELLDVIPHPVPARKAMPEWYKKLKPTVEGQDKADAGTVKRCMPVLDAVSTGYIIPLWADLQVKVISVYNFKDEEGKVVHVEATEKPEDMMGQETQVTKEIMKSYEKTDQLSVWMKFPEIDLGIGNLIGHHGWQQVGDLCDLQKFSLGKVLLKFTNPWIIETTPGYSCYFKNPANSWKHECELIEAVVDTDTYYNAINFPYIWTGSKEGEFIIPRGTPLVHVIPFKRTEVELEVGEADQTKKDTVLKTMFTKHYDRYKTLFWHKRK